MREYLELVLSFKLKIQVSVALLIFYLRDALNAMYLSKRKEVDYTKI